ncbi:MAG: diguanylate cyclase [Proteobacteria bacterium]|nr:diguanylate cyclase [Pseudomonadota bacterium]MBU1582198.1 diguanylate cyclase [Pseudomonadota bacterium]MBU2451766.1 diguanylate cyclase [Pseudomonadota bacterium]MBU2627117.1 diguanylate cyclase [Pseudomonadota bacterium]
MAYSILIVDDDTAIKESVEEYLKILNYEVKSALNADEALKTLDSFKADVVLTDIMMQGMDGLELTRRIKESFDTDVMVMTGYSADYSYEEAVQAGASDFIFKPFRFEELDLRIKRVLREAEFKKERSALLKELEKLAITDALTGLYNSRHFFSQIKTELKRYNRYSRSLSLLILDIDFFKDYNDTWGHLEGDKVLMEIGKTINACMRSMDTAYRYGGEEFAILLPETRLQKACVVGARIKDNISSQVFEPEPGIKRSITVSIGATELVEGEDIRSFISRTDKALYKSKETGRNKLTYIICNPDKP